MPKSRRPGLWRRYFHRLVAHSREGCTEFCKSARVSRMARAPIVTMDLEATRLPRRLQVRGLFSRTETLPQKHRRLRWCQLLGDSFDQAIFPR